MESLFSQLSQMKLSIFIKYKHIFKFYFTNNLKYVSLSWTNFFEELLENYMAKTAVYTIFTFKVLTLF